MEHQSHENKLPSLYIKGSCSQIRERMQSDLPAPPPERIGRIAPGVFAGLGVSQMKESPFYIDLPEDSYPVLPPREGLQEENIQRETERLTSKDLLLSRVVFDNKGEGLSKCEGDWLKFESQFESGNLKRAIQIFEHEYDLQLSPDYNTRNNTQWFYFTVSNTRPDINYRFNIINMIKPSSLYNQGMQPCIYSYKEAQFSKIGWHRAGTDVCYYQNNIKKKSGSYYFTLTFVLNFRYANDIVSIAHCYPYTYTDLNKDLNRLIVDPKRKNRLRKSILCHTLGGNACPVLTVTSFLGDSSNQRQRKGVFVMARVHPGESNASWMMKGLLDYLTGPSLDAKILRDNFIFKIIPMINPDGVISGAYRCGLAGVDLNRCWVEPNKRLHPTIFYAKNLIKEFAAEREVVLSCDFHGHSRNSNLFIYGCSTRNSIREKIFPKLMEKISPNFSFSDCMFGLQKAKEGTARVVLFREIGIVNSYTLESSFCGSSASGVHFSRNDLMDAGRALCETVLDFCDPDQRKVAGAIEELERLFPKPEEEQTPPVEPKRRATSKKKGVFKKRFTISS